MKNLNVLAPILLSSMLAAAADSGECRSNRPQPRRGQQDREALRQQDDGSGAE
jgi:hypothetical protein